MKEKIKKILLKKETIIVLLLLVITVISLSYAYFVSVDETGRNIAKTDCFKLTLSDSNDINIERAYPLSESEGSSLTPYEFTIRNTCNTTEDYQINIETLNTSTLDTEYVRIKLNNNESSILKRSELNSTNINQNVKEGRKIATGELAANQEISYSLRIWVDEQSTVEQSANKEYYGKVTVSAVPKEETHDIELAYIVEGVTQNTPPTQNDGYLISDIQCTNASGTWDYINWGLLTTNMTGRATCDITFVKANYNNVPEWLEIANIDKNYTTLTEVFNDTDTLSSLISNQSACDYLAHSTDWISDITANESAMTYIGQFDYCGDKLFIDNNWGGAIAASTYWDEVLEPLVPNMTSNTLPYGTVSASSYYTGHVSTYYPWRIFNNDTSNINDWLTSSDDTSNINVWLTSSDDINNGWVQYQFLESKIVTAFTLKNTGFWGDQANVKVFKIQGGDGATFTDLGTFENKDLSTYTQSKYELNNTQSYLVYRLQLVENNGHAEFTGIHTLQYYGR